MDLESIIHLSTTLVVGLLALLVSTNMLGKTQISQATPFHFISALVLGELLGNAVYDNEVNLYKILFAIALWTFLMFSIEMITQKFRKVRGFFEGNPSIVINKGEINFKELKKNRMDLNELQSLLRQKGVFSFKEVEYAILESNGSVSVLKKFEYGQPTKQELKIPIKEISLPVTIISDGEILKKNLASIQFDEKWVKELLYQYGIKDIKEVFYAQWDMAGGLFLSKKIKS